MNDWIFVPGAGVKISDLSAIRFVTIPTSHNAKVVFILKSGDNVSSVDMLTAAAEKVYKAIVKKLDHTRKDY